MYIFLPVSIKRYVSVTVVAGERRGLDLSVYVHGLTAMLLSQSEEGCFAHEVAALTLDSVAVTLHPHPHQVLFQSYNLLQV